MVREILFFVGGAAFGFAGCYVWLKKKFDTMVEEEVDAAVAWARKECSETDSGEVSSEVSHGEAVEKMKDLRDGYASDEAEVMDDKPYQISEEDYLVPDSDFDKVSLDYYTEDEALYDGDELIPNVDQVVGNDNMALLHGGPDDLMYIRNEKFGVDYEVCKITGAYVDFNHR